MVATKSNMLPIGTKAPFFTLQDVITKKEIELSANKAGKGLLVAFICNHCPFVIHLIEHLSLSFNALLDQDIVVYAISSNDIDRYPQDSPEKMVKLAEKYGFLFPYLYDSGQTVAHSFQAACTPDFFLFNDQQNLFYRGRYDATRPGSDERVNGKDLLGAVGSMLNHQDPPVNQSPSIGCNIKWTADNEPAYFKS